MLEALVAIALSLCTALGVLLRYAPFGSIIAPGQKRILFVLYTVVSIVNTLVVTVAMYSRGMEAAFDYLRFGNILYSVILTLVNIFVIRGRTREHLFVFGIVLTCNYLLLTVPNFVVSFAGSFSVTQNVFVVIGIYGALLLLTYWPLHKLLYNTVAPFLHLDSGDYWKTIWFIPITYFCARFLSLGGDHDPGSILQLFSSMLSGVMIIVICLNIAADHGRLRERQVMENQLAAQKLHYTELKVRVEEARKTNHDFKHHVAVIRHYMDIDDREGLLSYCDELMERSSGQGRIPYTGNAAADGVLYYYMQQAKQEHIHFKYSGTIHSHGIADIDLCALLGNALSNAFTACLTIENGRNITVVSQTEEQLLSVVIRNSFDGKVIQSGDTLLSRKRENEHGIGLFSMRSICERYGGSMQTQWDEHSFTVIFLLPLADEH